MKTCFLKTIWRRVEDVSARHLEEVFKTSWRHVGRQKTVAWKTPLRHVLKMFLTCLGDQQMFSELCFFFTHAFPFSKHKNILGNISVNKIWLKPRQFFNNFSPNSLIKNYSLHIKSIFRMHKKIKVIFDSVADLRQLLCNPQVGIIFMQRF